MSRPTGPSGDDRGYLVPIAVVALVLIGYAALLTARVVGTLVRASVQESLAAVERSTARTAAMALDAWMASRDASVLLTDPSHPGHADVVGATVWRNPLAEKCDWTVDVSCWRIDSVTPAQPSVAELRGGEVQREVTEIAATVVSGCNADGAAGCLRTGGFARRYERAIFAYYQLHYDSNDIPPAAAYGPDGMPDPQDCSTATPLNPALCDGVSILPGTKVVFGTGDTLTGPLRTGLDKVLYCGEPTFDLVEVGVDQPMPLRSPIENVGAGLCQGEPSWAGRSLGLPPPDTQDLLDEGRVVFGGDLSRVLPAAPPRWDHECATVDFGGAAVNLLCQNIGDGDVIVPPAGVDDIVIDELRLDGVRPASVTGSVTVYAPGNITIRGDVTAGGANPAGGPNVVALIAGGDIRIAPSSADGAACLNATIHGVSLTNVAILAGGAVYAPQWSLPPCATLAPELEIVGSVSAHYLGVYGAPDLATGGTAAGWSKQFSYPANFWLARPAWWPGFSESEWEPATPEGTHTMVVASVTPAAVPVVGPLDTDAALTPYTQARDCVVAAVAPVAVHDYGTIEYELAYQAQASTCRAAAGLHPDVPLGESTPNTLPDPSAVDGEARLARAVDKLARSAGVPLPPPHLLVAAPVAVTVTEGATTTFEVSLVDPPSDLVTVTIVSADTSVATALPAKMTFSTVNWFSPQTVTVTGVSDDTADDESTTVTATATSADSDYNGMAAAATIAVVDDDS